MREKIFDIIPPKKQNPPKDNLEKKRDLFLIEEKIKKERRFIPEKPRITPKSPSSFKGLRVAIILIMFLVLGGGLFCFKFYEAEVKIWPETETLNFDEEITIDSNINQVNLQDKIIPGNVFEDEKESSQQFSSTGKIVEEEKAKGIIRVYNSYSVSPQALLANTRFVSTDGALFKSLKKETVPGATLEKGKIVPSYKDIEVQSAEPGDKYNIGPSTFSIPGFAGTPKYTAFYGKSSSPMTGGFKGEISQITQQDLDLAESTLLQNIKKTSEDSLKNSIPKDFILLDGSLEQKIIDKKSPAKAGDQSPSFNLQMKVSSKQITFKKTDIEDFIKKVIISNNSSDKIYQEESLEISYSLKEVNFEQGKMVLHMGVKTKIYSPIEEERLKKSLAGVTTHEAEIFFKDQPQILKVKIETWPIKLNRIPSDINKIKIKLLFDN